MIEAHQSRDQLLDFLENNHVGVLATADLQGKPHAATVYLTFDQELNIYFVTRKNTRKSRNLRANGQVALTIYNATSQTTLQADGTAIEVVQPQTMQWILNDIWRIASHTSETNPPPQAQLLGAGEYIAYKLAAPSLRLATYSQSSPEDIFNTVSTHSDGHFNGFETR